MSHFSPKQVAEALGVSESSVKRWCDLGAVPVVRTAGGHRRIPRKSLEQLLSTDGDLASILRPATTTAVTPGTGKPADSSASDVAALKQEFQDSLRRGNEDRCRRVLDELIDSGWTRFAAAEALITDAMHAIGHLWERGEAAVYEERRACGICASLLHEQKSALPVSSDSPIAIGGSPQGDIYQLSNQLIELALCESGWRAVSLGCNLPLETFIHAVAEYRPRLLWLSLTFIEDRETFVRDFNSLARSLAGETSLIIGGRAATDDLRPRLHYTAHCDSIRQLVELASMWLPHRS